MKFLKNVTLIPDLNYPNNCFSQFFCLLSEELCGNLGKVALTEFSYPVNYFVNYGSFRIEIPSYLDQESQINNINFNEIFEKLENFEIVYKKFLLEQNEDEIFTIEESVVEIEFKFELYMKNIKKRSHYDLNLKYEEVSRRYKEFLQENLKKHNIFVYKSPMYWQFFQKIFIFLQELANNLEYFQSCENVIKKIDIQGNDRLNQKELISCFLSSLKSMCSIHENSIILLPFVRIIDVDQDLENFVTFKDNRIFFYKKQNVKIKYFFIYTDIISESSDKKDSVLRIISTKGKNGDQIFCNFSLPHFEPINKTRISKIWIKITDQNDELVRFQSGPIILKLQISKK